MAVPAGSGGAGGVEEGLVQIVPDVVADSLGRGDGVLEQGSVASLLLEQLLDVRHAARRLFASAPGPAALPLSAVERFETNDALLRAGKTKTKRSATVELHEFPVAQWLLLVALVRNFADYEFPAPSESRKRTFIPVSSKIQTQHKHPFGSPLRCIVLFRRVDRHIFSGTHSSSPAPKSTKTFDF